MNLRPVTGFAFQRDPDLAVRAGRRNRPQGLLNDRRDHLVEPRYRQRLDRIASGKIFALSMGIIQLEGGFPELLGIAEEIVHDEEGYRHGFWAYGPAPTHSIGA